MESLVFLLCAKVELKAQAVLTPWAFLGHVNEQIKSDIIVALDEHLRDTCKERVIVLGSDGPYYDTVDTYTESDDEDLIRGGYSEDVFDAGIGSDDEGYW